MCCTNWTWYWPIYASWSFDSAFEERPVDLFIKKVKSLSIYYDYGETFSCCLILSCSSLLFFFYFYPLLFFAFEMLQICWISKLCMFGFSLSELPWSLEISPLGSSSFKSKLSFYLLCKSFGLTCTSTHFFSGVGVCIWSLNRTCLVVNGSGDEVLPPPLLCWCWLSGETFECCTPLKLLLKL